MLKRWFLFWSATLMLVLPALPASAMGYDSLTCGELAERRIGYFTNNGFCAPGAAADAGSKCLPPTDGAKALPEADRTQVEMILKVEVRKVCPAQ